VGFRSFCPAALPCLAGGVNPEAESIIARLGLAPLPREGGYFRQTWLSESRLANGRATGSAIWFLLTAADFSALHRLQAEERWHFHAGDPVEHVQLTPGQGAGRVTVLGAEAPTNQLPLVVPVGVWQGARLRTVSQSRGWALVGCTLAPAWEDKDFELGQRASLMQEFPDAVAWINALAR